MRFRGQNVRLEAAPFPRGKTRSESLATQARQIRRLRQRVAGKTAALQGVLLWWDLAGDDSYEIEEIDAVFGNARKALII